MRRYLPVTLVLAVAALSALGTGCASDRGDMGPGPGDGPMGRGGGRRRPMDRQAQRPTDSPFTQYDVNGDGKVTHEEFMAVRALRLLRYDADGDGIVSLSELRRRLPAQAADRVEATFARLDSDRDGGIGRSEWDLEGDRLFRSLDRNADTVLAGHELSGLTGDGL
jgi:EF hand